MTDKFFRILVSTSAVVGEVNLTMAERKELEADPEAFAQSIANLRDLVGVIRWADRRYHDAGKSVMSDAAYDALKDELKHRKPTHSLLKRVGAAPAPSARKKVELPAPLFSLDKVKPDDGTLERWTAKHKGPYTISDKLDGGSLELVWDGSSWSAYTRGDGTIGQDVTHNVPNLRIPKTVAMKRLVVRGEAIMPMSKFPLFSKEALGDKDGYDNPRNLVTGALNKFKTQHEAIKHIDFIAYEIIEPRTLKPSQAFKKLKQLGFKIPAWTQATVLDKLELSNYLAKRKKISPYEIDGIVVEQDKINKRPSAGTHHPDYAVAFKMTTADQVKAVEVLAVEWEASKHGRLKPRIKVEPTRLAGVTIDYASGHNAYFIQHGYSLKDSKKGLPERPIGPGAMVMLTRSGDVIPYVMKVTKGVRAPSFPKEKFTWEGVDIVATVQTDVTINKQIEAFFKTVGIENIGRGVVDKLMSIGLTTVSKIITATPETFMKAEGVQERLAQKWYTSIHSKLKTIPLPSLMDASGVFGPGMGTRRCAMVIKEYPDILKMSDWPQVNLTQAVMNIAGFKDITAKQFAVGLPKFVVWLRRIGITPAAPKKVRRVGNNLEGQLVVFTGFRNKQFETDIEARGGRVGSGVSKLTTILIAKNPEDGSAKLQKARSQGIKIMSPDAFEKRYL